MPAENAPSLPPSRASTGAFLCSWASIAQTPLVAVLRGNHGAYRPDRRARFVPTLLRARNPGVGRPASSDATRAAFGLYGRADRDLAGRPCGGGPGGRGAQGPAVVPHRRVPPPARCPGSRAAITRRGTTGCRSRDAAPDRRTRRADHPGRRSRWPAPHEPHRGRRTAVDRHRSTDPRGDPGRGG